MSGHSKWANIKHRKGRQDAARGKLFGKLAKAIEAEPISWQDDSLELGVSYGVYTFAGGEAVDEALNAADHAMYASKRDANDATR